MAEKKVANVIKLQIPAGAANPAPPVGPALGAAGVNIMQFCQASGRSILMAGTEGFEPPTAGTKNRSSTVELRPSMGVAKSNSSSLPNLRGHRKRHRAGVRRVSARRWP